MAGNCRWAEAGTGTYGPRYHTQTSRANRVVENNRAVMRKPRCCAQTAPPRKTALPRANRTAAKNRTVAHKPRRRAQTVSLRANRAAAGIYLCGCAPEPVAARRGGSQWRALGGVTVETYQLRRCAQITLLHTNRAAASNRAAARKSCCREQSCCHYKRAAVGKLRCRGHICAAALREQLVRGWRGGSRRSMRTIALPRANRAVAHKSHC